MLWKPLEAVGAPRTHVKPLEGRRGSGKPWEFLGSFGRPREVLGGPGR